MGDHDHHDDAEGSAPDTTELARRDPRYPPRLELLSDPPERIFVRGNIPDGPLVALVGSRKVDPSARRLAHSLGRQLTLSGVDVISGGAHGVDTAAHEGALAADGRTVAVLGSGFDHLYPEANRELFAKLAQRGAVVSEFEPATPPTRWTFPRRNRLVAALASAVIVVQAAERSGALITARIARRLGIPVGAVPGAAGDARYRGCNLLIREGATLVEEPADVLEMVAREHPVEQLGLPGVDSQGKEHPPVALPELSERETLVLGKLGSGPTHIDEISAEAGLSAAETTAAMLSLELAGVVEDRGGKLFVRLG